MGGGIGMGNTCKPMAVLFQCMTKFTTNKKKNKNKIKKKSKGGLFPLSAESEARIFIIIVFTYLFIEFI